jgi:hypothetical protein
MDTIKEMIAITDEFEQYVITDRIAASTIESY